VNTGSGYTIRYGNIIPTAILMFSRSSKMTVLVRILSYVSVSDGGL